MFIFFVYVSFSLCAIYSLAEEATNIKDVNLENIIVYSSRRNLRLEDIADSVFVYSKKDWNFIDGEDVSDFCFYLPNLAMSAGGELGGVESLSLQGSSPRHVKVMLEGISLNSVASGQASLNKFPLMGLKQVEVIASGPSVLWGSGLGGVLNLVYQMPRSNSYENRRVKLWFARHDSYGFSLGLANNIKEFASLTWIDAGVGFGDRTNGKNDWYKFLTKVFMGQRANLLFGYSYGNVRSGILPDKTWYWQPYRVSYGKVEFSPNFKDWLCTLRLTFLYQTVASKIFSYPQGNNLFSNTFAKERHFGLSLVGHRYLGNNCQWTIGSDVSFVGLVSSYLSEAKHNGTLGLFSYFQRWYKTLTCFTGLRLDFSRDYGQSFAMEVGCKFPVRMFGKTLDFNINLSRAYSFPILLWRYYDKNLSGILPNPDIRSERADLGSVSLTYKTLRLEIQLTSYFSYIKDAIGLDRLSSGNYIMRNYKRFLRTGAYGILKYFLSDAVELQGGFQVGRVKNCETELEQYGVLKLSLFWAAKWRVSKNWSTSLVSYYRDWYQWPGARARDHKWIFDLELKRRVSSVSLFLIVRNIGNTKYWDDYFYPQQRRFWECGLEFYW